jgi:hypothetical protein
MARRSELISLDVENLTFAADGTGTALIRCSKTDEAGEGTLAYLSRETVRHMQQWLKEGNITEGAVFRHVVGRSQVGLRLHCNSRMLKDSRYEEASIGPPLLRRLEHDT